MMENRGSILSEAEEIPYLFTVNDDPEAVRIGLVYLGFSVFVIPFYIIFIWVLWTDKELKRYLVYRLLNHLNLIDFGQLLCHFISAFFPIFPEITHRSQLFSSFVGSTANSLWQAMFPYLWVVSISRILIIKRKMDANQLIWQLWMIIVFGWIFTIIVWLWSWFGMAFVWRKIGWKYDFSMWSSKYLQILEIVWCWPSIIICHLMYVSIIIELLLSRRRAGSRRSRKQEILIFCHSTLANGWMFVIMTLWHNSVRLGLTKNYHESMINCMWIVFTYLNPILAILLNKTVRTKYFAFILRGRHFASITQVRSKTVIPTVS